MVYVFKTPSPKAGRSVRFASSPVKSDGRLLGSTNLKSTVGQYSRTDHTNTVMVARLEPPVQGSTVEVNYSPYVLDHWANLPKAVNNLSLTAINFPLLSESPATDLNTPLKNRSLPKSTMNNTCPPALAPRPSRSASKGENLNAFNDAANCHVPFGATAVPADTPLHPTLYTGSMAFGSIKGSKHLRVRNVLSPNTTPDDDQDQPTKKKRRTFNKKGNKSAYPDVNLFDNFDKIIDEDRNLHYHERNNQFAAINTSNRANRNYNKAAQMQTTTTTTTKDDTTTTTEGTNNDPDGPENNHFAPPKLIYNHIDPTGSNNQDRQPMKAFINTGNKNNKDKNHETTPTKIATTSDQFAMHTPPNTSFSPPVIAYQLQQGTSPSPSPNPGNLDSFSPPVFPQPKQAPVSLINEDPTPMKQLCQQLLHSLDEAFPHHASFVSPSSEVQTPVSPSNSQRSSTKNPSNNTASHPIDNAPPPMIHQEIIRLVQQIDFLNLFSDDEAHQLVSNRLDSVQEALTAIINNRGNVHLIPLKNTMSLISHALPRLESYVRTSMLRTTRRMSKSRRNRTAGSRTMTVQSFVSPPRTLVDTSDPAHSQVKTMTWHDIDDSQHFCPDPIVFSPKTGDSTKTPYAAPPQSPDYYTVYSPCSFGESKSSPNLHADSTINASNDQISQSSPISDAILEHNDFAKQLFNGSDASDSYFAASDTTNKTTVVKTEPTYPSPPQWAYRASNPTDPSKSLTYLDTVHPVPIKLEYFPRSPATDDDFIGPHCYSCSNNESTREHFNFYPDAAPDPLPELPNEPDPAPMEVINEDSGDDDETNRDIGEPNEVPSAPIQQPVRMLPH